MIAPFGILAPQRIIFGRGKITEAPALISRIGRRVIIVHGRTPERGLRLVKQLRTAGCEVQTLGCASEPTLDQVTEATNEARDFNADAVVAIGGGSAIDLGKAVAALAPALRDPLDHLEVVGQGLPLDNAPLPFIAIPTTSGTGAEATKNAVIGVPSAKRKVSLRDERMIARLAIIDPALTDNTPRNVTLASGLDAITQVIEPYLCTKATPFTDALCRPAIPAGLAALAQLIEGEDPDARDKMAWVSLSGGLALANSGLGAVHGFAGVIGGATGAAHGAICGALLPHVLRRHANRHDPNSTVGMRIAEVTDWLSHTFQAPDGIQHLETWMHEHGLPRLSDLGVTPSDYNDIATDALGASSMKADPSNFTKQDLIEILQTAK